MSRNTDKIIKAVKEKGWEVLELTWEPISKGCEMCGMDGGWYLDVEHDGEKYDYENILGYNIEEVMGAIKRLYDYSKIMTEY